jgi:hypothetical protein
MTVQELIEELKQHDRWKKVEIWDTANERSTPDITITEIADGSILIW